MSRTAVELPAVGGAIRLGRYFQLISIVPALVVVLPAALLLAGGTMSSNGPSLSQLKQAVGSVGLGQSLVLVSVTVTLGMVLHPLQFAATQLLEGYWGAGTLGRSAMLSRARIHAHRRRDVTLAALASKVELDRARAARPPSDAPNFRLVAATVDHRENTARCDRYPVVENVLPTRLGNTLRRFEDRCGEPYGYGADGPAVVPHLIHLVGGTTVARVDDARLELDLAVRFVVSWCLSAVVLTALVWQHPEWLLCPAAAYALAWVSYRGACHAATEYGHAVWVLFDLHHPRLTGDMNVPPGPGTREERLLAVVQRANP